MIEQIDKITTKCATLSLIDKDVILIKINEGAEVDVEESKEMLNASWQLMNNNKYYVIIDARVNITATKEAREWGSTDEPHKLLLAQAFVVNSTANKLVGNFIIQFHKPKVKTKLFSTVESALKWINELKISQN